MQIKGKIHCFFEPNKNIKTIKKTKSSKVGGGYVAPKEV